MIPADIIPSEFIQSVNELLSPADAQGLLRSITETPAAVGVRLNPLKPSSLFEDQKRVEWCSLGRRLEERPVFTLIPGLHAGAFYVQEPASMVHSAILENRFDSPVRVLDLCAAPGGKSIAMLSVLPKGSMLVANEVNPQRAKILRENLMKWGAENYMVTSAEAKCFADFKEEFDIVAVDAPCSGEGMMRKDEEAARQWTPGLTRHCASLQQEILTHAVSALRPGGYLIYSTCTFNRLENEQNLEWMLENFSLESVDTSLAGQYGIRGAIDCEASALRFFPHLTASEGLFVALLRKTDSIGSNSRSGKKKGKSSGGKNGKASVPEWIETSRPSSAFIRETREGERVSVVATDDADLMQRIAARVNTLNFGIEAAERKGRDLIPTHDAFLSSAFRRDIFPEIPLTEEEALVYLRRENLQGFPDVPGGICCVTYKGLPLGRINNIGNRSNNLYPHEYKIRNL